MAGHLGPWGCLANPSHSRGKDNRGSANCQLERPRGPVGDGADNVLYVYVRHVVLQRVTRGAVANNRPSVTARPARAAGVTSTMCAFSYDVTPIVVPAYVGTYHTHVPRR